MAPLAFLPIPSWPCRSCMQLRRVISRLRFDIRRSQIIACRLAFACHRIARAAHRLDNSVDQSDFQLLLATDRLAGSRPCVIASTGSADSRGNVVCHQHREEAQIDLRQAQLRLAIRDPVMSTKRDSPAHRPAYCLRTTATTGNSVASMSIADLKRPAHGGLPNSRMSAPAINVPPARQTQLWPLAPLLQQLLTIPCARDATAR